MPKVVITGGAGFIGSNLAIRMIRDGWRVSAIDDLSFGSLSNLEPVAPSPDFEFVHADASDRGVLAGACEDADCVVHLAAYKIPRYGGALKTLVVNSETTRAVLEQAAESKVKTIIASTSDVYGKNPRVPFSEEHDLVLGQPSVRRWAYAISKAFDEQLAMAFQSERELPVCILRFFGCYGPHNHRSWWGGPQAVFIEQALTGQPLGVHGDGRQTRTFCYVSDTVEGIVKTIHSDQVVGEVINIGTVNETSILALAQRVIKLTGSSSAIEFVPYETFGGRYEDVPRRVPDLTKARELLGFMPTVSLDDGLGMTIGWHRKFHPRDVKA